MESFSLKFSDLPLVTFCSREANLVILIFDERALDFRGLRWRWRRISEFSLAIFESVVAENFGILVGDFREWRRISGFSPANFQFLVAKERL